MSTSTKDPLVAWEINIATAYCHNVKNPNTLNIFFLLRRKKKKKHQFQLEQVFQERQQNSSMLVTTHWPFKQYPPSYEVTKNWNKAAHLISMDSVAEIHLVGTSDKSWSIGSSPFVKPDSNLLFSSSVAWSSGTRKSSGLKDERHFVFNSLIVTAKHYTA